MTAEMKFWVGTSGYSYKPWRGTFYPEKLAAGEMLRFYASQLPAVEINNTFYRLPKLEVLQSWARQVPENFRFVLKAPRRITHVKKLKDVDSEIEYFFRVSTALGSTAGPVLFQLPPFFRRNDETLQKFLALLPPRPAAAFEFRHPSWFEESVFARLRERNCALCDADTDDRGGASTPPTANWGYVRLRRAAYSPADLARWKELIQNQPWQDAYVFFKHEDRGIGPKLAAEFLAL
jgi:uncharacterized protein YecE (DUF72 family)